MRVLQYPFKVGDTDLIKKIVVERSGTIVYPTETYYAIGCAAHLSTAVRKIYKLKDRAKTSPLLVLIDSWQTADRYIKFMDSDQIDFLHQYWPGALTAILPSKGNLAPELNHHASALGFRMTNSSIARELVEMIGSPLVGTSANLSNKKEASRIEEALHYFGDKVDLYIDGGATPGEAPSTIIDMSKGVPYQLVRQGQVFLPTHDTGTSRA